jgi:hypothetical protein
LAQSLSFERTSKFAVCHLFLSLQATIRPMEVDGSAGVNMDEGGNNAAIRLVMQYAQEGFQSGRHPWGVELEDSDSHQGEGDEGENQVDDGGDDEEGREDHDDGINGVTCLLAHDRQNDYITRSEITSSKSLILFYRSFTQIVLSWEVQRF